MCTACGQDICAQCHRATLTGYAICADCERKIRAMFQTPWESARAPAEYVRGFAATAVAVLTSTRRFFGQMPASVSWLKPAVFGVIAYAIGTCASFLWGWLFLPDFGEFVREYAESADLSVRAALLLLLLALPFAAPLAFAFHTTLLWASLRLFGAPAGWRMTARLVGFASASYLFQVIPPIAEFPIGYMLAIVWLVNVELLGVRRFFPDLGVWKSMAAVFIPFLLMSFVRI